MSTVNTFAWATRQLIDALLTEIVEAEGKPYKNDFALGKLWVTTSIQRFHRGDAGGAATALETAQCHIHIGLTRRNLDQRFPINLAA